MRRVPRARAWLRAASKLACGPVPPPRRRAPGSAAQLQTLISRKSAPLTPRALRAQVASWLYDKTVVDSIFAEVPARYAERRNDFTRVFPTLSRRGDNASMVILELV